MLLVSCDKEADGGLEFAPASMLERVYGAEGSSWDYFFTSEYDWSVECFDDWVSVEPQSGTKGENKFTITTAANDTYDNRVSYVVVKLSNGYKTKVHITQLMRERFEVESTEAYIVDAEATTLDIEVETNLEFIIDIPVGIDWIRKIEPETRGIRQETLRFEIDKNSGNKSRIATIFARDIRDRESALQTFTIIQSTNQKALNEIVYQVDSDKPVVPKTSGYGASYVTHLFDDGKGRIIFSDEVTAIPDYAFSDCDITEIQLPSTIRTIGTEAFKGCSLLTSLVLPTSTRDIKDRAFSGCTAINIERLVLPASIESLGGSIFEDWSGKLEINCKIPRQPNALNESHWLYGSEFDDIIVNGDLGSCAFCNYSPARVATFEAGCKSVGDGAFEGCKIDRVVVQSIATWCSISFNNGTANPLHTGNNQLIVNNEVVTELNNPESITRIEDYTFYNYAKLKRVTLNDNITSIDKGAFSHCSLESAYLGKAISSVGNNAFADCHIDLLTINFNTPNFDNNTTKSNHWFHNISADEAIFGEDVERIGNQALADTDIKTATIGENVVEVGSGAFANCSHLTNVTIGSNVKVLQSHAMFNCANIAEIRLPENLEIIDDYVFQHCKSLCDVTIPECVSYIGKYCFDGCSSLTDVYLMPQLPPTLGGEYSFTTTVTIHVPSTSFDLYREAENWSRHKDQIECY